MLAIGQQLKEIGLGRVAAAIQSRCEPSLRLTAGKTSAQGVSRLGGKPNLPGYFSWPAWQGRQPLAFVAQLDLAALPPLRGLPLPKFGSLFFFYDAASQPWGYDPKHRGGARVIYSASPLAANRPRPWPTDLDKEERFKGLSLAAILETTLPGPNHEVFRNLQLTEEDSDRYWSFLNPDSTCINRVGGHPDEIQGDVKLEAQLVSNGLYCGNGDGYVKGRKQGLDAGATDWRLLLQIEAEYRAGMMWGDAGRLYFMIHKNDLRRQQFENVWTILQCS